MNERQLYRLLEDLERFEIIERDKKGRPPYPYQWRKGILDQPPRPLSKDARIARRYHELEAAKALMKAGGPYEDPESAIDRWIEERYRVMIEPCTH